MRLYVYGGDKDESRRKLGDWNKLPSQKTLRDTQGLSTDKWSFGVGIIDNNPTLILREIQTDESQRQYPFVVLIDVGGKVWKDYGWNAAKLLKVLLESKDFEKVRFDAKSVSLIDLKNIFTNVTVSNTQENVKEFSLLKECIAGSVELKSPVCIELDDSVSINDIAYNTGLIPACFRCGNGWLVGGTTQQAQELGSPLFFGSDNLNFENTANISQKGRELLEFCDNYKDLLGDLLDTPKFLWSKLDQDKFNLIKNSSKKSKISKSASSFQGDSNSAEYKFTKKDQSDYDLLQNAHQTLNVIKQVTDDNSQNSHPPNLSNHILNNQSDLTEFIDQATQVNENECIEQESETSVFEFDLEQYLDEITEGQIRRKELTRSVYSILNSKDKRLGMLQKFFSNPPDPSWQLTFENLPFPLQDEIVRLAYKDIPDTFKGAVNYFYKDSVSKENKETLIYKSLAKAIPIFLLKETNQKIYQELIEINSESFLRNVEGWRDAAYEPTEETDWTINDEQTGETNETDKYYSVFTRTMLRSWEGIKFVFFKLFRKEDSSENSQDKSQT